MSMEQVEKLTRDFAEMRLRLIEKVQSLQSELEQLKRQRLPPIKTLAADVAVSHQALYEQIDADRQSFVKPKTRIICGIRAGLKKEKGKTVVENEAATIKLIRKHLPEHADLLIETNEKVVKASLDQLTSAELKKIGVNVTETTDAVYIKPVGDDIDKLVSALLEEGEKILQEVV